MQDIYYNGKYLHDFGAVISEVVKFPTFSRELEFKELPAKDGAVIEDKKRCKGAPVTYKVTHIPTLDGSEKSEFEFRNALADWLLSKYDYAVLRDSEMPGYFRKAVCTSIGTPAVSATGVVTAVISFYLDPFLYSDAGARKLMFESSNGVVSTTLINPELWEAEPVITIRGTGNFSCTIGSRGIDIENVSESATIDKPAENVYDLNGADINDSVLNGGELPVLAVGSTNVCIQGMTAQTEPADFTVEITPNWRRL